MADNTILNKIYDDKVVAACYFRSTVEEPYKKIIIQITETCNLKCKHCFVSSSTKGKSMSFEQLSDIVLPKLINSNTVKVTLTGGEPLAHPQVKKIIELFSVHNIEVAICTNGTLITTDILDLCSDLGNVHFNVSLDGFREDSHDRFRGNTSSKGFKTIINNISQLGKFKLLNGILVTPNKFAELVEYDEICSFAKNAGANYVLFNPLSEFGRGQDSTSIGYYNDELNDIKAITQKYCDNTFEVVYIRFPDDTKPLGKCPLGKILYIFANGDVAICPYMVFAANDRNSIYKSDQFVISNIFDSKTELNEALSNYKLPTKDISFSYCDNECSTGCYAAKISHGLSIYDCDYDLCKKVKGKQIC